MPFELGEAFNGGAEWVCASSAVYGALRNPVFTALLITALALIAVHAVYREALKGAGWRRGLKAGFWLVIGVSALVFVHYYALERSLQNSHASQGVRTVVESIHHSATTGGGYAVYPGAFGREDPAGLKPSPPPRRCSRPDNVAPAPGAGLGLEEVVLTSVVARPQQGSAALEGVAPPWP